MVCCAKKSLHGVSSYDILAKHLRQEAKELIVVVKASSQTLEAQLVSCA